MFEWRRIVFITEKDNVFRTVSISIIMYTVVHVECLSSQHVIREQVNVPSNGCM